MPSTVLGILDQVGLSLSGHTEWGQDVAAGEPGIYFVSLSADPGANLGTYTLAPISLAAVQRWLAAVPMLTLDGIVQPPADSLVEFLSRFWLPDENIVYIGKATGLHSRTHQLFGHALGRRSPHAGGHWIKTLSCLERLHVHFAECVSADAASNKERCALRVFASQVSPCALSRLQALDVAVPFANLRDADGKLKQRSLCHSVLR